MGVRGLTRYLQDYNAFTNMHWTSSAPQEEKSNRYIVIDGLSLCHKLRAAYKGIPNVMSLKTFAQIVDNFFSLLLQVVPRVTLVFDGQHEVLKDRTRIARRESRVYHLRDFGSRITKGDQNALIGIEDCNSIALYRRVLVDIALRYSLEILIAPGEADRFTAQVCVNRNASAVLSEDSDYFLLGTNYIPFSSVLLEKSNELGIVSMSFKLYTCESVSKALRINSSLFSHLACLLGNDYLSQTELARVYQGIGIARQGSTMHDRVQRILQWLRSAGQNAERAITRAIDPRKASKVEKQPSALLIRYKQAKQSYSLVKPGTEDVEKVFGADLANPSPIQQLLKRNATPPWLLAVMMSKRYWIPIMSCDPDEVTSIDLSLRDLRRKIYGVLFGSQVNVEEVDSQNVSNQVEALASIDGVGNLRDCVIRLLESDAPLEERQQFLIDIIGRAKATTDSDENVQPNSAVAELGSVINMKSDHFRLFVSCICYLQRLNRRSLRTFVQQKSRRTLISGSSASSSVINTKHKRLAALTEEEVISLIKMYLVLNCQQKDKSEQLDALADCESRLIPTKRQAHVISLFAAVVDLVLSLNSLLGTPFNIQAQSIIDGPTFLRVSQPNDTTFIQEASAINCCIRYLWHDSHPLHTSPTNE